MMSNKKEDRGINPYPLSLSNSSCTIEKTPETIFILQNAIIYIIFAVL